MKLRSKLLLGTAGTLLAAFSGFAYLEHRFLEREVREELLRDAREIRSVLMATRRVYHRELLASGLPITEETLGFLPAHAMSRISADFQNWSASQVTFNNVSDQPRNPNNAADAMEKEAMAYFRENPQVKERLVPFAAGTGERYYHYTSPIWVEPYCLECHDGADDAPQTTRAGYDTGVDWAVGDFQGVMSIKLPAALLEGRFWDRMSRSAVLVGGTFLVLFGLLAWFYQRTVMARTHALVSASRRVAGGDIAVREGFGGADELGELETAFDAMAGAVAERESEIRAVIDHALDSMVVIGEHGAIEAVNPATERLFGYDAQALLGREITELMPERFRDSHRAGLNRYLASGESRVLGQIFEVMGLRRDGTEVALDLALSELPMTGHRRFLGVMRDLTERKAAMQRMERDARLQTLLRELAGVALKPLTLEDQLQEALDLVLGSPWYPLQRQGCVFLANEQAGALQMTAQTGLPGSTHASCAEVPFGACICGQAASRRELVFASRVNARHERCNPSILPHGHYCVPIIGGDGLLGVLNVYLEDDHARSDEEEQFLDAVAKVLASLIELKRAEAASQAARDELEQRVAERTRELAEANSQLKELDRLKTLLLASMSHELRTPLNSIIGFAGVLREGLSGELNPTQRDQLHRIHSSATHLLALIADIIDLSKVEAGKVDVYPESFRLSEIFGEGLQQVRAQAQAKGISLDCDLPEDIELHTDRKRVFQCLLNLLTNAVKYTEKGNIRVWVRGHTDTVEIAVTDTGIGVPESERPRLFQPFTRLQSHLAVRAGGTGLGLYLVQKLATEILDGEVFVQSKLGVGSTFGIRIARRISARAWKTDGEVARGPIWAGRDRRDRQSADS